LAPQSARPRFEFDTFRGSLVSAGDWQTRVTALDFAGAQIDNEGMALIRAFRVSLTWLVLAAIVCTALDVRSLAAACAKEATAVTPCGAEAQTCCCGSAASETVCGCRQPPPKQVPAVPPRDDAGPKSVWVAWPAASPLVIGTVLFGPAAAGFCCQLHVPSRSIQTLLCVWRS
jgi:hypothetical protein